MEINQVMFDFETMGEEMNGMLWNEIYSYSIL